MGPPLHGQDTHSAGSSGSRHSYRGNREIVAGDRYSSTRAGTCELKVSTAAQSLSLKYIHNWNNNCYIFCQFKHCFELSYFSPPSQLAVRPDDQNDVSLEAASANEAWRMRENIENSAEHVRQQAGEVEERRTRMLEKGVVDKTVG